MLGKRYTERTGKTRKINGLQLGYEARCAPPHAFDVILGSQLGVGAYRALVEHKLNGVMVSVSGQFDLHFVPFNELVDPQTLVTKVVLKLGISVLWPTAFFNIARGNAPGIRKTGSHFGQRP
jgi:ATP-dependent phosphofructokinase / diphosphate-dependent phosphofructokinase